jgi:hypothetical protein
VALRGWRGSPRRNGPAAGDDRGGDAALTEEPPLAWQDDEGRRVPVSARYALGEDGTVGFVVGAYDRGRPLTIDPVIVYSTFLGGSIFDIAWSVAADAAGNAYIAGDVESTNFPTVGPYQPSPGGQGDAFVAKFAPDGTPLYSTYLGGSYFDYATEIAVDAQGNAYVTGKTGSVNFPTVIRAATDVRRKPGTRSSRRSTPREPPWSTPPTSAAATRRTTSTRASRARSPWTPSGPPTSRAARSP